MLVHFAEAGNGAEARLVKALRYLARVLTGRTHPGDAAALDDDLLVLEPGARMHIKQASDPQDAVSWAFAQRHQQQVLPDADFVTRVEDQIVGEVGHSPC